MLCVLLPSPKGADNLCCAKPLAIIVFSPLPIIQSQPFVKIITPPSPSLETFLVKKMKPHTQSSEFCRWIYHLSAKEDFFQFSSNSTDLK